MDLATFFAGLGAVGTVAGTAFSAWLGWPAYQHHRTKKALEDAFGQKLFGKETIENSTHYYVRPNCSAIDPGQEAEYRQVVAAEGDLLTNVDKYLTSGRHHLLILADSGMGKTSFVLNYYAYNQRKPAKDRWRLAVVPLGEPEADRYIAAIDNKENTVLFLDAFDEDTKAIEDYRARLTALMDACQDFKRIVITCRTQFFQRDEEIPRKTGVSKVGPRKAGEGSEYEFWKLYLLPLSDAQVQQFLHKRYRFSPRERHQAWEIVQRIPNLSARPMLLAAIPDLLKENMRITSATELYEAMVEGWLKREDKWVPNSDALRAFSEHLAVDLYVHRQKRGGEHIPAAEIEPLAKEWKIPLKDWQLRGRSLLNRDGEGNYKFAHRSIMEYLFVKRLFVGDKKCLVLDLTDQMQAFQLEIIQTASFQNAWGMEFVLIPPGQFEMGSEKGDANEQPVHAVSINQPFFMGKYPVTQRQWEAVMGNNPSRFKGADRPVETVSWNDTQEFLRLLNERDKDRHYRLPTEAEWEYAARAGSRGAYCFGDDENQLAEYAWYGKSLETGTQQVGRLKPNAWGLYDMHGNVWEWVQDWYAGDYYHKSPTEDPPGPDTGEYRVLRGGAYFFHQLNARCAARFNNNPRYRNNYYGIRVVVLPKL